MSNTCELHLLLCLTLVAITKTYRVCRTKLSNAFHLFFCCMQKFAIKRWYATDDSTEHIYSSESMQIPSTKLLPANHMEFDLCLRHLPFVYYLISIKTDTFSTDHPKVGF